MMVGFRRRKTTYAGLAVEHDRLSLIRLTQIKHKMVIDGMARSHRPADPASLGEVLRQLVLTCGADQCHGALAFPISQVTHKRIRVPAYLTYHEQATEIQTNFNYYLPGMDDPLYFDFFPTDQKDQEIELQLIAVDTVQMETWLHLTEAAGLKIDVVDVDIHALERIDKIKNGLDVSRRMEEPEFCRVAYGLALRGFSL